jgi:phosphoribosylaminoimidazolecarboxamide formyltransferase/IMP cyclohydrolase
VSKVRRALLSVSDKSGLVELARALNALGIELLSTGGTARLLQKEGIAATEVSSYTGFPEMLDGRVKTLHPKIHAGLLARRDDPAHLAALQASGIGTIDLVVVNLYPFQAAVADADCRFEDAIENIDIGGPAMLRSAAKNHAGVAVVVDPADYGRVLEEIRSRGEVSTATRFMLAAKVFAHTAAYDGAIANYLSSLDASRRRAEYPGVLSLQFRKREDLTRTRPGNASDPSPIRPASSSSTRTLAAQRWRRRWRPPMPGRSRPIRCPPSGGFSPSTACSTPRLPPRSVPGSPRW